MLVLVGIFFRSSPLEPWDGGCNTEENKAQNQPENSSGLVLDCTSWSIILQGRLRQKLLWWH